MKYGMRKPHVLHVYIDLYIGTRQRDSGKSSMNDNYH